MTRYRVGDKWIEGRDMTDADWAAWIAQPTAPDNDELDGFDAKDAPASASEPLLLAAEARYPISLPRIDVHYGQYTWTIESIGDAVRACMMGGVTDAEAVVLGIPNRAALQAWSNRVLPSGRTASSLRSPMIGDVPQTGISFESDGGWRPASIDISNARYAKRHP